MCGLGAVLFGSWIGSGGLAGSGTPTPSPLNAGILATPLINVQVDPVEASPGIEAVQTPTAESPAEALPATPLIQPAPSNTPELPPTEIPTLIPTRVPPDTATPTPSPTATLTPTPSATPQSSPLDTPTATP
jgi:hypothetical protein